MRIVITDLFTGRCDLTGKENVECLKVQLDDAATEVCCIPAELIKLLRLRKKQEGSKTTDKKGPQP